MSRKFRNKILNLVYECIDLILCGKEFQSREPWALNEKRPISVSDAGTISSSPPERSITSQSWW